MNTGAASLSRLKIRSVPPVPCKHKVEPCKFLSVQKFVEPGTRVNGALTTFCLFLRLFPTEWFSLPGYLFELVLPSNNGHGIIIYASVNNFFAIIFLLVTDKFSLIVESGSKIKTREKHASELKGEGRTIAMWRNNISCKKLLIATKPI